MHLYTAGLLVIEDRKLLLAYSRNKACYYLPGGKIDAGETPAIALCREIAEELQVQLTEADLQFYTHISAPAFGEAPGIWMEQDCFRIQKTIYPKPGAEIGAIRYFSLAEYRKEKNQAPGAVRILELLQTDELVE